MNLRRPLLVSSISMWCLTVCLMAFSAGGLPRLTGGFQEETCQSCHQSFSLNEGRTRGGVFHIAGVPADYVAGQSYPIRVLIGQPGQSKWGFELSVRSVSSGSQAGELVPADDTTQRKEANGVQYIQHTSVGNREGTLNGPVAFHFNWIAPDTSAGPIYFNAAGSAADSSGDPVGDYVYSAGGYSHAAGAIESLPTSAPQERPMTRRLSTASRFMHLPAPRDLNKGEKEVHIEHRFLLPLLDSRPGNAFGTDSGANINLGFNYAVTDELAVGLSRARWPWPIFSSGGLTVFKGTYEVHHNPDSLWKMSLVGGVEAQENFLRHYSPFVQLPISLDYKRLRTYLVPTMILNSRKDEALELLPPEASVNPDDNHTFSLGLGADLALHRRVSLAGEYVPRLAGYGGLGNERSALSWGVKLRTYGHVFTIMITNTRNFTPGTYGVNAETTDFALGFNIYRRF